jgi:hypothetical protein
VMDASDQRIKSMADAMCALQGIEIDLNKALIEIDQIKAKMVKMENP